MRGFLEISENKLPKRAFRARLPRNFTEQASKTSVSCEASSKFHRTSFQNKRFVRGFLEISQNKLPKRAFRARLPPNFIQQCFQNEHFARGFLEISQNKLPKRAFRARLPPNFKEQSFQNERFARCFHRKFAFRHSFVQSTHRIPREGSSRKSKMCVSLQRRAIQNFKMHVLLQWRAQKCMNPAHDVRGKPRRTKITISPQFRTSDHSTK